jgi:hypothetical protein
MDDAHIGHFDDRDRPATRVDDHRTVPDAGGREGVRGHAATMTTPQPIRAGSEESSSDPALMRMERATGIEPA